VKSVVFDYNIQEMRSLIWCENTAKRTYIITDNASNFVKFFRTFSSSVTSDHSTANYDIGNLNSDDSGSDTIVDNSDSESENGAVNIGSIHVGSIFYNQDVQEQEHDNSYCRPKHIMYLYISFIELNCYYRYF